MWGIGGGFIPRSPNRRHPKSSIIQQGTLFWFGAAPLKFIEIEIDLIRLPRYLTAGVFLRRGVDKACSLELKLTIYTYGGGTIKIQNAKIKNQNYHKRR